MDQVYLWICEWITVTTEYRHGTTDPVHNVFRRLRLVVADHVVLHSIVVLRKLP
jgi:hypothetical protein